MAVTPITGRQAKIATALQANDGNAVPIFDAPVQATHVAKIATSNLKTDAKKVIDDSLEDRASETGQMVVGTSEPDGDVEFNVQEEGATGDLLAMHYGNPTTTQTAAVAAAGGNPAQAAFYEHIYKNTNDYRLGTIVEKIGPLYHFVYWGCRAGRLSLGVRKTQDRPVFMQANIMALNSLLNRKAAAGTDTGMGTAARSGTPIMGAVRAILTRSGSLWAGAQDFNFTSDGALARTEELDGYRGMAHHCPDGKKVTADATLYFSTDAEYRKFTGNSVTTTDVFGPGWDIIEDDIELVIPGAIRNLGTDVSPSMFQPLLGIGLLRGVIMSPLDKQVGKNAIMLKVNLHPMHKTSVGTDSYLRLRNQVTNANMIAAGTSMLNVPANAGSAFISDNTGTQQNTSTYASLLSGAPAQVG